MSYVNKCASVGRCDTYDTTYWRLHTYRRSISATFDSVLEEARSTKRMGHSIKNAGLARFVIDASVQMCILNVQIAEMKMACWFAHFFPGCVMEYPGAGLIAAAVQTGTPLEDRGCGLMGDDAEWRFGSERMCSSRHIDSASFADATTASLLAPEHHAVCRRHRNTVLDMVHRTNMGLFSSAPRSELPTQYLWLLTDPNAHQEEARCAPRSVSDFVCLFLYYDKLVRKESDALCQEQQYSVLFPFSVFID
jgi:hypothetical protein